jgi:predicted kinase
MGRRSGPQGSGQLIQKFARSTVPCTIVAGPPASGKTSWVNTHKAWSDLCVDTDTLFIALSAGMPWYEKPVGLLDFVFEARDAVIRRLSRKSSIRHAWIITGEADIRKLRELKDDLGADKIVVLETSESECLSRIARDPRRSESVELWRPLVKKWWHKYRKTCLADRELSPTVGWAVGAIKEL